MKTPFLNHTRWRNTSLESTRNEHLLWIP